MVSPKKEKRANTEVGSQKLAKRQKLKRSQQNLESLFQGQRMARRYADTSLVVTPRSSRMSKHRTSSAAWRCLTSSSTPTAVHSPPRHHPHLVDTDAPRVVNAQGVLSTCKSQKPKYHLFCLLPPPTHSSCGSEQQLGVSAEGQGL